MRASRKKERLALREQLSAAALHLAELHGELSEAYAVFNRTADAALTEACILEISALHSRYGSVLRDIKTLNGELNDVDTPHTHPAADRGRRPHMVAAEAAAKADQVGI